MYYDYDSYKDISVLIGKTLVRAANVDNDEIVFETETGGVYALFHQQDCCESVMVEDVCGDLNDLVGTPILQAEEVSNIDGFEEKALSEYDESHTWTFYKLATIKGYVTIRFYGTSTGYYSESVSFVCRQKEDRNEEN